MKTNLSKNFFLGGNATFTVDNGKGEHFTYKIRQPKPEMPFFVSLMTGPDNESNFTYMGVVSPLDGHVKLTAKSRVTNEAKSVKVAQWALNKVWTNGELPEGYNIRHAGKCGCCGRKLTNPDSLTNGIGPECAKRFSF